jgi:hypothetical protein
LEEPVDFDDAEAEAEAEDDEGISFMAPSAADLVAMVAVPVAGVATGASFAFKAACCNFFASRICDM